MSEQDPKDELTYEEAKAIGRAGTPFTIPDLRRKPLSAEAVATLEAFAAWEKASRHSQKVIGGKRHVVRRGVL